MIVRDFVNSAPRGQRMLKLPGRRQIMSFVPVIVTLVSFLVLVIVASTIVRTMVPVFLRTSGQGSAMYVPAQVDRPYPVIFRSGIDAQGNRTTVFLQPDLPVDAPGGYGSYRLNALYALYKLEGKNDRFIKGAFSQLLGIRLSGVFSYELTAEEAVAQEVRSSIPTWLLQSLVTWLAGSELPLFSSQASSLESVHTQLASVEQTDVQRRCPVAVLNATGQKGLAQTFATMFERLHYVVIHTGTLTQERDQTEIIVSDSVECQQTAEELSAFFTFDPVVKRESIENDEPSQYRAEIVIVVGKVY